MKKLLACAVLTFAAGCSIIPDPPPAPRIYPLRAEQRAAAPTAPIPLVIGVPEPAVSNVLAGDDIVWMRDGVLGYMERGAWSSRTPLALQALVVETIDAQDVVLGAIRSGEGPRADAELRWQVADFQIEESSEGLLARFTADVKLMNGRTREVVAATRITRSAPVPSRSGQVAATTLQTLARAGAVEIADWAAKSAIVDRQQRQQALTAPPQPSAASTSK